MRTSLVPALCLLSLSLTCPAVWAQEPEAAEGEGAGYDESPQMDRPAAPGKIVIWGTVTEEESGEPIAGVEVAIEGSSEQVFTDDRGQYRFEVAPGRYDLTFWIDSHAPTEVVGIFAFRRVNRVDELLTPFDDTVETIVIEVQPDTSSVEGQLMVRRRSAAVGDAMGRAEISKGGDKNAAEAAKRVVGSTIVGGRFVYVRGLGERYTNALLDGAPLPSPEPDRQTVPLDLFPSLMLDSLTINKTFTPDMPGDFAGGSVQITTRRLPEKLLLSASASLGVNTESTFRDGLSYTGSVTDWLGYDGGLRSMPSEVPDYRFCRGCRDPNGEFITAEALRGYGQALNSSMSTKRAIVPPNHGGNIIAGHTWELDERRDRKLGFISALTYSRAFEQRRDEILRTFGNDPSTGDLRLQNDLKIQRGIDKVRWGVLAGVTYQHSPNHRFHLTGLHSRSSDKEATELEGHHEERGALIHETRLSFVSRSLLFGQLRGEHDFSALNDANLTYSLSLSRAERDEPDTRATVFEYSSGFGYAFEDDSQSGLHFFSEQGETSVGGSLDWTQPLSLSGSQTKIKLGGLFSLRSREFDARRFRFRPAPGATTPVCAAASWDPSCPDQALSPENIGDILQIEENTQATDAYTADLDVFAGYFMADSAITDDLRMIVGPRLEVSRQSIKSFDRFSPDLDPVEAELEDLTLLPALSLIYSLRRDVSFRLAGSRTLARPQLRELAPFSFADYYGGRVTQGNPNLEQTRIYNADLRAEWFPTSAEVVAATFYYKHFEDPIEQVIRSAGSNGILTFENADSADLFGFELELRKSFDFITPVLSGLSFISNLTLSHSRISLAPEDSAFVTSQERPLSNQSPYIVNLALDYTDEELGTSARILYNVTGEAIVGVGTQGLPDIYQQPRHQLDIIASQRVGAGFDVKASAKNITDAPVRETHGSDDDDDKVVHSYSKGVTFSLGASYTY